MTKYHRKWDRRGRLLNAIRRLLAEINNASNESVMASDRPRGPKAELLYKRSKFMISRIDRELGFKLTISNNQKRDKNGRWI